MFPNFLKVTWRNLIKNKITSFITISGLSLGIAVTLLTVLYVNNQLSYDGFHANFDKIYRVISVSESDGEQDEVRAKLFAPLAPLLQQSIPEVEQTVRFFNQQEAIISYGESVYLEENNLFTDPSFFRFFSFELLQGDRDEALARPFTMVVTPEFGKKYFGDESPIGKVLIFGGELEFEVTGVVESPSLNSSIQYDYLLSFSTLYETRRRMVQENKGGWGMAAFDTYLLLKSETPRDKIEQQILPLIRSQTDIGLAVNHQYKLESLRDVYMKSYAGNTLGPSSNIKYVYIFSIAALLVLIISCFNYTNIAIAQYTKRAKEVGIRKTAGAGKASLLIRFLSESIIICILSLVIALLLLEISLPYFNGILGLNLTSNILYSFNNYSITILAFVVLAGTLSGLYPALVLSRFDVSDIFRHSLKPGGGIQLRKLLITIQFALSIGILICTIVMQRQLDYVSSKNLGLESSQVMVIQDKGGLDNQAAVTFRDQLMQHSGVISASISGGMATKGTVGMSISAVNYEGDNPTASIFAVDKQFKETLGLTVQKGRFFYENIQQDAGKSVIVNQATVRKFGWREPIGKTISFGRSDPREVIGVVKDFHFESLHKDITPVLLLPYDDLFTNYVSIKFQPGQVREVIDYAQENWESINKAYPFEYFFLDKSFDQLYKAEEQMATLFNIVTGLTIFIACMGLYGLVFYMARRRTKEIGIRKVLGANIGNLAYLLCRDLLLLVIVGFVIAIPVVWYFMNWWLADFAYRIEIGPGIFVLAGVITLGVALITVSWHAIRASLANPVESLRSE